MVFERFKAGLLLLTLVAGATLADARAEDASALTIGETFTVQSEELGEVRRINVFTPSVYGEPVAEPLPVLYMLDGGIDEDFLHIAGLLQISVSNRSVRPFRLVGIENTERGRDMTGPSEDPRDHEDVPSHGGAASFRRFIAETLVPAIEQRYPVTQERALMGESLAGLFVVETLLEQPTLFQTYIAADPSVWWNEYALNETVASRLQVETVSDRELFIAAGQEANASADFQHFLDAVRRSATGLDFQYHAMTEESHATLYHPAALRALRALFPNADTKKAPVAD